MIDVTQIVLAIIGVVTAIITIYVLPWLRAKAADSRTSAILNIALVAVSAAEQIFLGQGRGKEKLEWAIDYVGSELEKVKISVDEDAIKAAIEAAVREIKL